MSGAGLPCTTSSDDTTTGNSAANPASQKRDCCALSSGTNRAAAYATADAVGALTILVCSALLGDTTGRDSRASGGTYERSEQVVVFREQHVLPKYLVRYTIPGLCGKPKAAHPAPAQSAPAQSAPAQSADK